ncbi:hypothetical protein M3Y96_01068900 [Aphelenchoides besseyi]|nr:hypothetical protein M3Y96_01068900 [Aphelenchoides besseyi]
MKFLIATLLFFSARTTSQWTNERPTVHFETMGSFVFDDDTHYQALPVVWEFPEINCSSIDLPKELENNHKVHLAIQKFLHKANQRITSTLEAYLPPTISNVEHRHKRALPLLVVVVSGAVGFGGGLAGAAVGHILTQQSLDEFRKEYGELSMLTWLEVNLHLYTDALIANYTQQLNVLFDRTRQPYVLNENRIAEYLKTHAGSGRVIDVEIMNIIRKPAGPGNLLEIQGVVHFRSTATEYPLYSVHPGGQFSPTQTYFFEFSMKPFWVRTHKGWLEVDRDRCMKMDILNATICGQNQVHSTFLCNPTNFAGCSVTVKNVKPSFVLTKPLINSVYIATNVKTYQICNEFGNTYYNVPKGGVFYLSTPPHSKIAIGTKEIPGSGVVHQVFQTTEKVHLTAIEEEAIDAETNYIAAGQAGHLKLQEFTFFNRIGDWFADNTIVTCLILFGFMGLAAFVAFYICRRYHEIMCKKTVVVVQDQKQIFE